MRKILLAAVCSAFTVISAFAFAKANHQIKHEAYLLQRDFNKIDVQKTGKLSKDDLNAYFKTVNQRIEDKIQKLEKKSNDEKNMKKKKAIDRKILKLKEQIVDVDQLMETFDHNHDDYITKAEIRSVKKSAHSAHSHPEHK